MHESHNPARNPPICPKKSMLFGPTEVNRMVNTISITHRHANWHFNMGPIWLSPRQLIIKYPIIIPNMPYKQVDAPALRALGLHRAEKMLPAIAVTMYMIMHLIVPKLY